MAVKTILPDTNLTYDDVRDTLASSGGVVNNDMASLFTANAKINKWAKYKPVYINQPFINLKTDKVNVTHPITGLIVQVPAYYGAVSQSTRNIPTSLGNIPVNFIQIGGFEIPELVNRPTNNAPAVIDGYNTNGCNWEGVVLSTDAPKRLGDFRGYNKNSINPFYFEPAQGTFYKGEFPAFNYSARAEASNQWGLDDMSEYLSDKYRYAVIITKDNYTKVITGELVSDSTMSSGTLTSDQAGFDGTYKAYFVAIDTTNNRILLMPSSEDSPNPATFKADIDNLNPSNNPFNKIFIENIGFAYSYDSSYWESFNNVQEGDYVTLNTIDKFSIKQRWTIQDNAAPSIDFGLIGFSWLPCGKNNNHNIAGYRVFINGVQHTSGDTYTFQAGKTYDIIFELQDIFLSEDGSRNNPYQGEQFSIDPWDFKYSGSTQLVEYMDVTYDPTHNGQFYNAVDGYYTSR